MDRAGRPVRCGAAEIAWCGTIKADVPVPLRDPWAGRNNPNPAPRTTRHDLGEWRAFKFDQARQAGISQSSSSAEGGMVFTDPDQTQLGNRADYPRQPGIQDAVPRSRWLRIASNYPPPQLAAHRMARESSGENNRGKIDGGWQRVSE